MTTETEDVMSEVKAIWEAKKAEGWTMERLGIAMGYAEKSARQATSQFLKGKRPQLDTLRRFAEALGVTMQSLGQQTASPPTPSATKPRELPYDPILATIHKHEYARRTIVGILESYNSNYDAIAEAVQNSMDAIEDAAVQGLPGPYLLEVTVDLKDNSITVLDTGVGMSQDQICEAFAPAATFKDLNYAQSILKKRGDKHNYRGYKGVGLTFLAYGTDDIWMQSRSTDGAFIKVRMRQGRQWAESKIDTVPMLEKDNLAIGLEKHKRGTAVRMVFSANTRPSKLANLGTSIGVWESILRTRTAAGQVCLGRDALAPIKVRLVVISSKGAKQAKDVVPEFYYPHLVERNPKFKFLDVRRYHEEHPGIADYPANVKRQDGVYLQWSTEDIRKALGEKEVLFRDELNDHRPDLYAFRPYNWPLWTELNRIATEQDRTHFFSAGLVVAVDRQRLADITPIKASRWTYVAENTFVLFHFDKAKPDLGRKTLQSKLMELAQSSADAVVQFIATQNVFLKQAGEKSTPAQREVELEHEDWVDNVKAHFRENPMAIPPASYVSEPLTEQDVIGLFNQLSALGLFPGLKIYSTSSQHTYDCYVHFDYRGDMDKLRYKSVTENPLGLSDDVLPTHESKFQTKGLTLEFKSNLEGLISDIENQDKRKTFPHVDILVCWGAIQDTYKGYNLVPVDENNLYERKFPGVTHLLSKDGEGSHIIQVVLLEHVVKQIQGGHIRLN